MRVERAGGVTLTDFEPTAADFRAEVIAGLRCRPRRLPCKFFYDERGSALFDEICTLPEYYPTRTEMSILERNLPAITQFCGSGSLFVELGSGSSRKTRLLLDHLERPAGYVPIDISRLHLQTAAAAVAEAYPGLEVLPVCADYAQSIRLPVPESAPQRNVIFFPGSTIGNFEPRDATTFLAHIASWCRPGDRLLIGVDLEKPRRWLEPAYDDARGVTAAFNLNLLLRANTELGANFDLDQFSHQAIYDARHGRIEMRLISACTQRVEIDSEVFDFEAGDTIVTEYSYKYRPGDFEHIAAEANWHLVKRWTDPRAWFGVFAFTLSA
jgi:dimethylhistidine N-methyltransferase